MRTHFGCALLLRAGCAVCLLPALAGWTGAMAVAPATPAGASPADTSGGPHAPTGPTFWVNTAFDGVYLGACAGDVMGQCTLREAILEANATTGATINLPGLLAVAGSYRVSIPASGADDGTTGDLHLTADMSLVGHPSFARPVIIDATGANDRVFCICFSVTVNISNVTIRNGAAADGAGIYSIGALSLTNTTLFSNTASSDGGGIYNAGTLTLTSTTVLSNTASGILGGGGIFNGQGATLAITNSAVISNTSTGSINALSSGLGGGLFNAGTLTVTNSTIRGNAGSQYVGILSYGGGIYNGGVGALTNVTLSGNSAYLGGGIFNHGPGTLTVTNSTISSNTANGGEGGILNSGTLALTDSTVSGNTAQSDGGIGNGGSMAVTSSMIVSNAAAQSTGGISNGGTLTLTNSTISSNTATVGGGGIGNGRTLTIINSTVSGNTGQNGGGIDNGGSMVVTSSTVISNTAYGNGGAIYNYNYGALTLTNSTVSRNTANNNGGGLYNDTGAAAALADSSVIANTAGGTFGGGLFNAGTLTVTNSTVSDNAANSGNSAGGGILNGGAGTLTFVTLSGNTAANGGGIYQEGSYVTQTVTLMNTIIADSPSGGDCVVQAGSPPLRSGGYNLSSDGACAPYFTQTGDLNGANPNLGPLADNGGPTLTQRPLFPSPVMDAIPLGTNGCGTTITTDQRGLPRATDGRCDIGAVEYGGLLSRLWLPLVRR